MSMRQYDTWIIYRDPEEVLTALNVLLEHKDEITEEEPVLVFVNCSSSFTVDGKKINRYVDTLVCSKQADMALCLTSARYYDEDLGLMSATAADVIRVLNKNNIPYRIVAGKVNKSEFDDRDMPETWLIREAYVLEDSLSLSAEKGITDCVIYPDSKATLSVGYYLEDGTYHEVWGLNFDGLIEVGDTWNFLINENDKRNLSIEDAKKIILDKGLRYTIGKDPMTDIKNKRKVHR